MFDYSSWFDRAAKYVETLKMLPGDLKIDGNIRQPISHEEVDRLANRSRLPIPREMRQLWTEGSSHSNLTYSWTSIPSTLRRQVAIASCDRFSEVVWGGPEFLSAEEIIELSHELPDWAKGMRPDHPKDARMWDHSLPLIPVGNGDYVGLYVDDERTPCSVVYLCHEASGGSCVIANSLDEFLVGWEELCYIGTDFLMTYCSRESDVLAPSEHSIRAEILRSLLRGETRDDLVVPPLVTSEQDWLNAREPDLLLEWLEQKGLREERKTRLYCCACCRRVWNQLGASGQHAVEVSELYADGRASDQELAEVRLQLSDGIELSQHLSDGFVDALSAIPRPSPLRSPCFSFGRLPPPPPPAPPAVFPLFPYFHPPAPLRPALPSPGRGVVPPGLRPPAGGPRRPLHFGGVPPGGGAPPSSAARRPRGARKLSPRNPVLLGEARL